MEQICSLKFFEQKRGKKNCIDVELRAKSGCKNAKFRSHMDILIGGCARERCWKMRHVKFNRSQQPGKRATYTRSSSGFKPTQQLRNYGYSKHNDIP